MEVRAARADEVDAIVALVESAYRGDGSRAGWTTEADLLDGQRTDADEVRSTLDDLLIVEDDAEIVACCALVPKGSHAYFGMFAVRPGRQAGGIGSRLLRAAEESARERGLNRVEMSVLSARAELIAYYERRGYRSLGRTKPFPYGDERFGIPRRNDLEFVILAKQL